LKGSTVTFAEKLKSVREKARMSQSDLHRASGLSLGAIHDYEQGKREPSLRNGFRLATALGVDVNIFADCEEPRTKKAPGRTTERNQQANPGRGRPRPAK
jgi:transcriptional regulator with XRE-family HTH domain